MTSALLSTPAGERVGVMRYVFNRRPTAVHRSVIDTATHPGDLLAAFASHLMPLFEQTVPVTVPDAVTAVDRYAFRRALLTGLDGVVHFGHAYAGHAVAADGRIGVRIADGRVTTADVLVGADGVGSRVRALLLPELPVLDIGVRCISWKLPIVLEGTADWHPAVRGIMAAADADAASPSRRAPAPGSSRGPPDGSRCSATPSTR